MFASKSKKTTTPSSTQSTPTTPSNAATVVASSTSTNANNTKTPSTNKSGAKKPKKAASQSNAAATAAVTAANTAKSSSVAKKQMNVQKSAQKKAVPTDGDDEGADVAVPAVDSHETDDNASTSDRKMLDLSQHKQFAAKIADEDGGINDEEVAVEQSATKQQQKPKKGGAPVPPAPSTVIMREFMDRIGTRLLTFAEILDIVQKLARIDRPILMVRVIRIAEGVALMNARQRARLVYLVFEVNVKHYRFDRALRIIEDMADLPLIAKSLSIVITGLLSRKTLEANNFAIAIDLLMTKRECEHTIDALSAILLIHSIFNRPLAADFAYERILKKDAIPAADAFGFYVRLIAPRSPQFALSAIYRFRRRGGALDSVIYSAAIRACNNIGQVDRAVALFDLCVRDGLTVDVQAYESLIYVFSRLDDSARLDEFVAWMKAQRIAMNAGVYDSLLAFEIRRQRVQSALLLMQRAIEMGCAPSYEGRYADLVRLLLAADMRRPAQTMLQLAASKVSNKTVLVQAATLLSSAFRNSWSEAVDWLLELRGLGVPIPPQNFASVAVPLGGDVDANKQFIARMRENQLLGGPHYAVALRNVAADVDVAVALFRQMIEDDGILPSANALQAMMGALVSAGRRHEALRYLTATISASPQHRFGEVVLMPLIQGGAVHDESERKLFQLDSAGFPSAQWAQKLLDQKLPLESSFLFRKQLALLYARNRELTLLKRQMRDLDATYPQHHIDSIPAVMRELVSANEHDKGESHRVAAEMAMQLFETLHKIALTSPLGITLPVVRRFSAFRDGCFDRVPQLQPSSGYSASSPLADLVERIIEQPVRLPRPHPATSVWLVAMRACEIAQLDKKGQALMADWKVIEATLK